MKTKFISSIDYNYNITVFNIVKPRYLKVSVCQFFFIWFLKTEITRIHCIKFNKNVYINFLSSNLII